MRGWLAIGLILFLSLSGCAQKSEPSGTMTAGAATTAATTGSASANRAPTANLTALAGNGTAALNVTFTLSGADADGDALNWTLSFGDNSTSAQGNALPANATHAYAKAGSYNVTLTVSDGRATAVQTATVTLAAPANATGAGFTPVDETKPWTVSVSGAYEYANGCAEDGVDCAYFDLPAGADGRAYTLTVSATVPAVIYFLDYYEGDEFVETVVGEPAGSEFTGTVPAGITQFRVYAAGGADFSAHLVIP